jgi:hypothetical protein
MAGRLFGRSRQSDRAPATPSLAGLAATPHPIDVTLFTADGVGDIQVLAGSGRITELLNAKEPIRVRARPEESEPGERPWIDLDEEQRNEILALVPPPRETNPLQRLHRPAQQVSMRIGPYFITGEAHVPAGAEATGFLMRHQPHFTPLTRARITQAGEPDVSVPVVIVNLRAVDELTNKSQSTPESLEPESDERMAPPDPIAAHEPIPPSDPMTTEAPPAPVD